MGQSKYKIKSGKQNGLAAYPKTVVEAIIWDREKKKLEEVLDGKMGLVANPVAGELLATDAEGKAVSSGKKPSNFTPAPATAGTAGQVLALDAQGNPVWVDAATGGTYDSVMSDSSTNAPQNKTVKAYADDNFAKKDGSYDALTAGRAKNIDGLNSLEGTFLFRTTAGDADVASGAATVEKVKGNAVAFNQLAADGNTEKTIGTTQWVGAWYSVPQARIKGHKYYLRVIATGATTDRVLIINQTQTEYYTGYSTFSNGVLSVIHTMSADDTTLNIIIMRYDGSNEITVKSFEIIDLTLAGVDTFTADSQVEAWLAANVGNKPYFPATQKLLPTKLLGLKTRGFNQWDEVWENGSIATTTGANISNNNVRSKNFIPILPNTQYYCKGIPAGAIWALLYDSEKNVIGGTEWSSQGTERSNNARNITAQTFVTAPNAAYLRFYASSSYGTTYNNDICINLSWDGSRDGEYEPAEIHEYNIDVTKFYGKLNGEGDLVQIFPNGMKKADYAGTIRDLLDLVSAEADVKVEKVDLGDLTYIAYDASLGLFRGVASGLPANATYGTGKQLCAKYIAVNNYDTWAATDKSIALLQISGDYVFINDSSLINKTASEVKTAMDGVYLYYELATPLHYTDLVYRDNGVDTPVEALNILVNNWGTEEEIVAAPEASGEPNSCAATLDILYGIDAAEQLDTINQSGIFTDSLKANLEALIGVLNTNCSDALGGTIAISDNPTDKVYTFTFTPNAENNG